MEKERKIYLVRHGELYEEGEPRRCLGQMDVPMTEKGECQARKIGGWFRDKDIGRIYSSPLQRCVKTAQIINGQLEGCHHGMELIIREDLRELDVGKWENLSFVEIREKYPDEYETRGRQPGSYAPPGGESFYQAGERFCKCLDAIRKETDGNILIIAHAGVIRGYLSSLLGISSNDVFAIPQPNAGITVLQESSTGLGLGKIGWRPSEFLDEEEIQYLYRKCRTPKPVIRHMEAVADYLDVLREELDSDKYDWELLRKAALVHDICRTKREHAKAGADVLRKEGYEEAAKLVKEHHSRESPADAVLGKMSRVSEEELLFYADKRIQEDRLVSVEERFEASLEKCKTQEAKEKHQRLYEKTKCIETKIENLVGGNGR